MRFTTCMFAEMHIIGYLFLEYDFVIQNRALFCIYNKQINN